MKACGLPLTLDTLYLVMPKDRAEAKLGWFQPRSDVAPVLLEYPLDWAMNPYSDRNWQFNLHALRSVDIHLIEHLETGGTLHLSRALDIVIDWLNYHVRDGKVVGDRSWKDMAVGIRASKLAYILTEAEQCGLELSDLFYQGCQSHIKWLADGANLSKSNHGIFQSFGLYNLASVYADSNAPKQYFVNVDGQRRAEDFLEAVWAGQFTVEGVHKEHSPEYHVFATRIVKRLAANGHPLAQIIKFDELKAEHVVCGMTMPNGRFAQFGDTELKKTECSAASIAPNKDVVFDFTSSGLAKLSLVRAGGHVTLAVTGACYSVTHKHADDLSFELYSGSKRVFRDSGKYGYFDDENRNYIISADAHNTIGLSDRRVMPRNSPRSGSFLSGIAEVDKDLYMISGGIRRPNLFNHERRLFLHRSGLLILRDKLYSKDQSEFMSSLHLEVRNQAKVSGRAFSAKVGSVGVLGAFSSNVDRVEVTTGVASDAYKQLHEIDIVRAHKSAKRAEFFTCIVLLERGNDLAPELIERVARRCGASDRSARQLSEAIVDASCALEC